VISTLTETGLIVNSCPNELLHEVATIIKEETTDLGKVGLHRLSQAFINDSSVFTDEF